MTRTLPSVSLDLTVEHGGHQVKLSGSGTQFVARFPNLSSMMHFARVGLPLRQYVPSGVSVQVECGPVRFPFKFGV